MTGDSLFIRWISVLLCAQKAPTYQSYICFTEDISQEDLIIDVDNHLARQLHKKWEKSVQVLT